MAVVTTDLSLSDADFRRLSELVYRHCGINLHEGKRQLAQARLAKRMRDGDFATASDYLDFVVSDTSGRELTSLTDAISTNLTSFFREKAHFDHLTRAFLPSLVKAKGDRGRLRAWSAGCSTGEEAYTIAITLLESLPGWDVKILATDISTRVLATASAGEYGADRVGSIDPGLRSKYFAPRDSRTGLFRVGQQVRSLIQFRHLNLMQPWPFSGPFDFIFCRNVMIYFDKPTQEKLVQRYWDCLDRGGLLFTGHSESLTGISHRFRYVEPSIYAKA